MNKSERVRYEGDFSSDIAYRDTPSTRVRTGHGRHMVLVTALAALLILPPPAFAADESTTTTTIDTGSTTTTIEASTTTTAPESTTTTADDGSTTTTLPETTTTVGLIPPVSPTSTTIPTLETTTTTVPVSTPTTAPAGDPYQDEEPEDAEELPLPSIRFPVAGPSSYRDTWDAPRDGGARRHRGTDIIAAKGTPIVAVANGVVTRMGVGDLAGLYVVVRHSDGWSSAYVHLDNDSPGTDNGLAVGFGPGIQVGTRVQAGTVLGYLGNSGNAEDTTYHLHFELHQPDGLKVNPYEALRSARRVSEPRYLPTVDYDDTVLENAEFVGHYDPTTGFNAELAVVDTHAYIGTWGTSDRCPGTGVRIVDFADPEAPEAIGVIADHTEFPGTAAQTLWVGNVVNENFEGRLGVVGLRDCDNPLLDDHFVGFAVYDLTDPLEPELVSTKDTGDAGVEHLDVVAVSGKVTLAAVVPTVRPNTNGPIDVVAFYDLTNPAVPEPLSLWQPPVAADAAEADDEEPRWFGGTANWNHPAALEVTLDGAGSYVIDTSDLAAPVEAYRTEKPAAPEAPPVAIAAVEVEPEPERGFYGTRTTSDYGRFGSVEAGLSDGASVLVNPDDADSLASIVPAPAFDPQRWWVAPNGDTTFPMVWDVVEANGLIYVSDHHSGLWAFRVTAEVETAPLRGVAN